MHVSSNTSGNLQLTECTLNPDWKAYHTFPTMASKCELATPMFSASQAWLTTVRPTPTHAQTQQQRRGPELQQAAHNCSNHGPTTHAATLHAHAQLCGSPCAAHACTIVNLTKEPRQSHNCASSPQLQQSWANHSDCLQQAPDCPSNTVCVAELHHLIEAELHAGNRQHYPDC